MKVGHDLNSCTETIQEGYFEIGDEQGIFIDTPGFDDTYLSDTEILKNITLWMGRTYV